jgi:hypothetical protein
MDRLKTKATYIYESLEQRHTSPLRAYFVKDISRQSEIVDYGKIW